jgi:hypothetical protein
MLMYTLAYKHNQLKYNFLHERLFPFDFLLFYHFLLVIMQRQPEIHLFCARFKEQAGDIVGARGAYQLVHTEISPGLLEAIIRHANMEHRLVC